MRLRFHIKVFAAIAALTFLPPAAEPESQDEASRVDQLFDQWNRPTSPGCAVAIMQDAKIVYERGYDMADLDHNVRITPKTIFHVASMSKQFTAAAVLMLATKQRATISSLALRISTRLEQPAF